MKERTAEQIFRRYIRTYRLLRALRWLGCGACMAVLLPRIWWGKSVFWSAMVFLFYLLYLWGLRLVNSLHFLSLNLILNRDCDAVRFTEVSRLLSGYLGQRSTGMAGLNVAQGLYWSGRFDEARRELEQVRLKRKNLAAGLLLQNLKFNCAIRRRDLQEAQAVREKVQRFAQGQKDGSSGRKNADHLLFAMEAALALEREDWDAYRAAQSCLEKGYRSNLQKVSAAWHMAKADLAQGEKENARVRLELVAGQGGTLYMVEEAKKLLESGTFS